ncbi:hypothetical protein Prudu_018652 [Prunus dulcis]|uniref:Uncharacterized protein n=1 Tax=Prunus dulcis TaxID=3755 RepID=A0A4Y1RSN4_PRUDU|nr:hypothetical protein Prudu_018652 [Prunus dulcis]
MMILGKNKDEIAARLDLLNMGVKINLQPEYRERRTRLPPGPWNLSRAEKRVVQSELNGEDNNGVPENLRWLAASPSMVVPSYRSCLINGVKFNTKAQDDV